MTVTISSKLIFTQSESSIFKIFQGSMPLDPLKGPTPKICLME